MKRMLLMVSSFIIAASLAACSDGQTNNQGASPQANGKKAITISVLKTDRFLQLAEQLYEEAHPDIDIQLKEYTVTPKGEDGEINLAPDAGTVEKFVNTVGTEILSGKGSDLIDLRSLPMTKYVEKKALVDLNEMMAEDSAFDVNQFYGNILDPMKINGGLYAVPLQYNLKLMIGDAVSIHAAGIQIDDRKWDWSKFAEVAKQLVKDEDGDGIMDKFAITSTTPDSLLVNLLLDNYGKYVDAENKQAHFDSEAFLHLLKQVKGLYDDQLISGESASWGEQFFSPWTANSAEDLLLYPKAVYDGNGEVYRKPGMGQGITFSSGMMLGINANSNVKEEAWDFLKFLLSEEMQSSPELKGFSLRKSVVDAAIDQVQLGLEEGTVQLITGVIPKPFPNSELQSLKSLIEEAGIFSKSDPKVISIIYEESSTYYAGQKSAEEVAKLIQNRVTTYMNE